MSTIAIAFVAALWVERGAMAQDKYVITKSDCRQLVRHKPRPDVTFTPGVDVRGKPVAPADLGGSRIALPDEIVIDVTVQVYEALGRTPPKGLGDSAARLGTIVLRDGALTFNGEPLGTDGEAAIASACREMVEP